MLVILERIIERALFASRWIMAPFYLGLAVALILLLVKFMQELFHAVPNVFAMSEAELVLSILSLIDLSLAGTPFESEVLQRALRKTVAGQSIRLATPEDLVILKAIAHRPQDLDDMDTILRSHAELDLARVRRWVKEFAAALEMPEIDASLQQVLKRRANGA